MPVICTHRYSYSPAATRAARHFSPPAKTTSKLISVRFAEDCNGGLAACRGELAKVTAATALTSLTPDSTLRFAPVQLG